MPGTTNFISIYNGFEILRENYLMSRNTEDTEELKRRDLRAIEFSKRFSRNYLYTICRSLDEIKNSKSFDLGTKIMSVLDLINKALDYYSKNMFGFASVSIIPPKIERLFVIVTEALDMCSLNYNFSECSMLIIVSKSYMIVI